MSSVFFYISGHGFGHASRQIEVINALRLLRPDINVAIRSSAERWLFERTVRGPFTLIGGATDTGVVQIDSLRLDEEATIRHAAAFTRTLGARAADEAAMLREHDARLVIADAPPLACMAAARAQIPSVVASNFTWDWIYAEYREQRAAEPDLIPRIQDAYRHASAAWRLPMHGGFETFDRVVDLPFIARHATREAAAVRTQLRLPADRPLVLSSFGGYGLDGFDPSRVDCLDAYGLVITVSTKRRAATNRDGHSLASRAGIYAVDEDEMYELGFRYEDLVAAVDIVATKPGYGILSECIANDTAVLYTSRGRFAEYEVMVAEMPRYLKSEFVSLEDLLAGRWRTALDALTAAPPPRERPDTRGAEAAAAKIVAMLE